MSARKRAFSKRDREELQEMIDANFEMATPWIRKREQKLLHLEEAIDPALINEAQEAIFVLSRKLDFETQQEEFKLLWDIQGALAVWYRVNRQPQNVKVAAREIVRELEGALEGLAARGIWTRRNVE